MSNFFKGAWGCTDHMVVSDDACDVQKKPEGQEADGGEAGQDQQQVHVVQARVLQRLQH